MPLVWAGRTAVASGLDSDEMSATVIYSRANRPAQPPESQAIMAPGRTGGLPSAHGPLAGYTGLARRTRQPPAAAAAAAAAAVASPRPHGLNLGPAGACQRAAGERARADGPERGADAGRRRLRVRARPVRRLAAPRRPVRRALRPPRPVPPPASAARRSGAAPPWRSRRRLAACAAAAGGGGGGGCVGVGAELRDAVMDGLEASLDLRAGRAGSGWREAVEGGVLLEAGRGGG